jgi:soluble lytic murein transglycosylase-like protein
VTRSTRQLSLFGHIGAAFLVPANILSAVARSRGPGRPPGRREPRLALEGGEHGGSVALDGTTQWPPRARRASVSLLIVFAVSMACTLGASAGPRRVDPADAAIAEAALRFSLPPDWIGAVIQAESGGRSTAISVAGAMGLMQLMPATWGEIRTELRLGDDPFDLHDNVVAGAFYLRQLLDRFGPRGFLAAYNAGPGRYEQYLVEGRALPLATRLYVARLAPVLGLDLPIERGTLASPVPDWRTAGLFVTRQPSLQAVAPLASSDGRATP